MTVSNKQSIDSFDLTGLDQRLLFGQNDMYLRLIEGQFQVKIVARGDVAVIEGAEADLNNAKRLLSDIASRLNEGYDISDRYVRYAIEMIREEGHGPADALNDRVEGLLKSINPRTVGQKQYLESIQNNDIVFSIGPAGTGKTFLAVAQAVAELKAKQRNRIILVRPAVEAGESLGFLPGDIKAKIDPYLRPVYDALHELLPAEKISRLIELGIIEISPLAFMRGRTLNNSFVILDEAQNTTLAQMKMFLTRLGEGSRTVITGDITQIDLDKSVPSGLVKIQKIISDVHGIEFVYLTSRDVVRHRLVQDVIKAFAKYEKNSDKPESEPPGRVARKKR